MRVVLFVIDGLGVGALPDAARYGDEGSNTLLNTARVAALRAPVLDRLGLGRVQPAPGLGSHGIGAYGRMAERSAGKDSMTGHWELAGIVTEQAFATYPDGFPPELVEEFESAISRRIIGNEVMPGTDAVVRFGEEALQTGAPILYTSVDSVFQLAAHTDTVPTEVLYGWCERAREVLGPRVARVIARPFTGQPGAFRRLDEGRRDYPVPLPAGSVLEHLDAAGIATVAVGKVRDLFPGHAFTASSATGPDTDMVAETAAWVGKLEAGFVFANASGLDSTYAHRNDPAGWSAALSELDEALAGLLDALADDDVLIVTGDHGNDPTTPSTDHSREYVPVLACTGAAWRRGSEGRDLGTRDTFADVAATVCELWLGTVADLPGTSFAPHLR